VRRGAGTPPAPDGAASKAEDVTGVALTLPPTPQPVPALPPVRARDERLDWESPMRDIEERAAAAALHPDEGVGGLGAGSGSPLGWESPIRALAPFSPWSPPAVSRTLEAALGSAVVEGQDANTTVDAATTLDATATVDPTATAVGTVDTVVFHGTDASVPLLDSTHLAHPNLRYVSSLSSISSSADELSALRLGDGPELGWEHGWPNSTARPPNPLPMLAYSAHDSSPETEDDPATATEDSSRADSHGGAFGHGGAFVAVGGRDEVLGVDDDDEEEEVSIDVQLAQLEAAAMALLGRRAQRGGAEALVAPRALAPPGAHTAAADDGEEASRLYSSAAQSQAVRF